MCLTYTARPQDEIKNLLLAGFPNFAFLAVQYLVGLLPAEIYLVSLLRNCAYL